MKTICFFCQTNEPDVLERNEFYAVDIRILKELGYKVVISTSFWKIPKADLYFVWWWTWAFAPLVVAKFRRRPCVICGTFDHVLPDGTLQYFPNRPWIHRQLIKLALRYANTNIVCSEDQEEYLAANFNVSGLEYSPHVLNTDLYKPSNDAKKQYLLSICWLHNNNPHRKCIAELIEAFSKLQECYSDYKLFICGRKGSAFPSLQELTKNLRCQDKVEFLGPVSTEEKIELLQHCELYLQPTRAEGFGVAILEAMACGAPVITSPVGPVPRIAGDAAVYVDGECPLDISKAAQRLLADSVTRASMGQKGRERSLEFGYERRKSDFQRVLQNCFVSYKSQPASQN